MSDPRTELTLEIEEWERQAREILTASGMSDQDIEGARDGWDEGFIDDDPDAAHQARTAALDLLETVGELRAELRRGSAPPERFALLGMEFQGAVVSMLYPETRERWNSRRQRRAAHRRRGSEGPLKCALREAVKEIETKDFDALLDYLADPDNAVCGNVLIQEVDRRGETLAYRVMSDPVDRDRKPVTFKHLGRILREL